MLPATLPLASIAGPALFAVLFAVVLVLLVAGPVYVRWRRRQARLERLLEVARAFGSGDLARRMRLDGDDELADLACAFDLLADQLGENLDAQEAAALRLWEQRLFTQSIYDSLVDALVVFDPDGLVRSANRAAIELLARAGETLEGTRVRSLLDDDGLDRGLERLQARAVAKGPQPLETTLRTLRGQRVPAHVTLSAVVAEHGEPVAYVLVARDVRATRALESEARTARVERKRVAELADTLAELEAAKARTEDAHRVKSAFLANMSHEIRTPINGIIGLTQLVLETELSPDGRHMLTLVDQSAGNLRRIIDDVLDIAKGESGQVSVQREPMSLRTCVEGVAAAFAVRAHERGLELVVDLDPDLPEAVLGDAARLRQVLTNLVGNALKFTETGYVAIAVRARAQAGDLARVSFEVADTGIGIPADRLDAVFGAFQQADDSTTRRYGGTGLGLTICRQLVEAMEGSITVESREGLGTLFRVVLPMEGAETPADLVAAPLPVEGIAALVACAHNKLAQAVARVLRAAGAEVEALGSLEAVVARLRSDEPASGSTVVLLDARLVEGDLAAAGATVHEASNGRVPLLLLADAHAPTLSSEALEAARIREVLRKPPARADLARALDAVFSGGPPSGHDVGSVAKQALAPRRALRILLVDDWHVNLELARRLLERWGHEVVEAAHGAEALELLDWRFDVVLMDLQMPVMGGVEATAAIRALPDQTLARVPIVAVTAHALPGERERCLALGMDGYVAKPLSREQLFREIERVSAPAGPGRPGPEPPDLNATSPIRPQERVSPEELLALFQEDEEDLLDAIEIFLAQHGGALVELATAVQAQDCRALREAAHRFKGFVGLFGPTAALAATRKLERFGRSQVLEGQSEALVELRYGCEQLALSLREAERSARLQRRADRLE